MEHRLFGKTGFYVSILAFGGMIVRKTPQSEANRIVAEAVDRGINYYDVAPSYGDSEGILGKALRPYRSRVYLACKTGIKTKMEALWEIEGFLELLETDYFDLYQLHGVRPDDVATILGPGGALEALVEIKKKGLARNIGITTHYDSVALKLMNAWDFDTLLFPVNWACWIKNGLGQKALDAAIARNMGRIAVKALADRAKEPGDPRDPEGLRGDGYPKCWYRPIFDDPGLADLALRFTLSQDIHTALCPGDVRLHRLALSIFEKYKGNPPPLCAEEFETLKEKALLLNNPIIS